MRVRTPFLCQREIMCCCYIGFVNICVHTSWHGDLNIVVLRKIFEEGKKERRGEKGGLKKGEKDVFLELRLIFSGIDTEHGYLVGMV